MRIKLSIVLLLIAVSTFGQFSDQNKELDQMIKQGIKDWKIPGMAVTVVKDGEVVFLETYGVKDQDSKEKVDKETLFTMASTTKAMVAISIGILVDRGKLNWDDKVRDHLPSFKLNDSYTTADARVKDLLTHNLGLPNADFLWIIDSLSTDETLEKFSQVESAYPLRGGYTYQNIMYAVAGKLIEEVSGQHWSEFLYENLLKPLGLERTVSLGKQIFEKGNYATPHYDDFEEGVVKVPMMIFDQVGAAGMNWASIEDMGNYMSFLVNDGIYKGDTLVLPSTFNFLFEPQSFVGSAGFYPTQQLTKPNWMTYGLGWFQHDYRGEKLDFHTGSISGLVALAGIMRDKNTAVYVLANLDHAELRHAVLYKAMDLYAFDDGSRDWHQEIFDLYSGFRNSQIERLDKWKADRDPNTSPSFEIEAVVGTYVLEPYGKVVVSLEEGKLTMVMNDFLGYDLSHWQFNSFVTNKDPRWRSRMTINFSQDANGDVTKLEMGGDTFIKQ